jgi:hypothetical protein
LHSALGNDDIGILLLRVGHQKLELAGLVATRTETCAVISLNVNIRTTQVLAKARQEFEWGG